MKRLALFLLVLLSALRLQGEIVLAAPDEANGSYPPAGVFGESLFTGRFAKESGGFYDPDYRIYADDLVRVKLWGAIDLSVELPVDSKGNIFIPKVGPVQVLGVRHGDLDKVIGDAVKRVYKDNIAVYAEVGRMQPVSVFVTGNVRKPGLYKGLASESILQFLDRAGGVDPNTGSYRRVKVVRNNETVQETDLYAFLTGGEQAPFRFRNGDVVVVENGNGSVQVRGDVKRPLRFELLEGAVPVSKVLGWAMPMENATNFTLLRYGKGNEKSVSLHAMDEADRVVTGPGDMIECFSDHAGNMIQVTVEGEHKSLHKMVVPKGSTVGEALKKIVPTNVAAPEAVRLFRKSVAAMQKQLLEAKLKELETLALTTPSVNQEEAMIRAGESKLILTFIDRARQVEPQGQVVLDETADPDAMLLEDGDRLYIPARSDTVLVHGEVSVPSAHTFRKGAGVEEYVAMSGGYNERANEERVLLIRQNGKVEQVEDCWFSSPPEVRPGDAILALPKVESKDIQIAKDITQIIYQIAVSAGVVLSL